MNEGESLDQSYVDKIMKTMTARPETLIKNLELHDNTLFIYWMLYCLFMVVVVFCMCQANRLRKRLVGEDEKKQTKKAK